MAYGSVLPLAIVGTAWISEEHSLQLLQEGSSDM